MYVSDSAQRGVWIVCTSPSSHNLGCIYMYGIHIYIYIYYDVRAYIQYTCVKMCGTQCTYICMNIYIYTYVMMCVYIYIQLCASRSARHSLYMYVWIFIYIYIYMYICVTMCVYIYTIYVRLEVRDTAYICMYEYT